MAVLSPHADHLTLAAPFHPELSSLARRCQGRWRGKAVGWIFARDQEQALREGCLRLWGVDGRPETMQDHVTLRIEARDQVVEGASPWEAFNDDIWLCGRQIAVRPPRGRIARPGKGIKFLAGLPRLHIMTTHHVIHIERGTVFLMREVPRMTLPWLQAALERHGTMTHA